MGGDGADGGDDGGSVGGDDGAVGGDDAVSGGVDPNSGDQTDASAAATGGGATSGGATGGGAGGFGGAVAGGMDPVSGDQLGAAAVDTTAPGHADEEDEATGGIIDDALSWISDQLSLPTGDKPGLLGLVTSVFAGMPVGFGTSKTIAGVFGNGIHAAMGALGIDDSEAGLGPQPTGEANDVGNVEFRVPDPAPRVVAPPPAPRVVFVNDPSAPPAGPRGFVPSRATDEERLRAGPGTAFPDTLAARYAPLSNRQIRRRVPLR